MNQPKTPPREAMLTLVAGRAHRIIQELLREERKRAALRQQDLAQRLGQPQSFVSKYESGERRLDVVELREVCKALGISLGRFIQKFEQRLREHE